MKPFKASIAGALLTALAVSGAALAQDAATQATPTQATPTQTTETKATETPAAPAAPAAESKAIPAKVAATAAVPKATPKASSSTQKVIIGEVVDPACWIVNGAKGEAHKECALACAKAGQVLGILERKTNKLFLIATERPGEDPNKGLIDYCGQTVSAKGRVYTRGGFTAIQLASVEPFSGRATP
jgi:hypothetical protein